MGPHPYPYMVREFQRVVGDEAREQCRALLGGADPDVVVACVGGGSNAAGTFAGFVDTAPSSSGSRPPAARRSATAFPGIVHGMRSQFLQDEAGQILEAQLDLGRARLPGHRPRARPPGRRSAGPGTRSVDRRRGPRRLPAPRPHRGHHPGARAGARAGLARPGAQRAASSPPGPRCSSPCRAGATRTSPRSWRCSRDRPPPPATGARPAGSSGRLRARRDERAQAARPLRRPAGSATSGSTSSRRSPRPAPTPSRSGSPSPTRSWTGRSIQAASAARPRGRGDPPLDPRRARRGGDVDVPVAVMTYYNLVARAGDTAHGDRARRGRGRGARSSPTFPSRSPVRGRGGRAGRGRDGPARRADHPGRAPRAALCRLPGLPLRRRPARGDRGAGAAGDLGARDRPPLQGGDRPAGPRRRRGLDADQARELCEVADGVVVGSALVRRLLEGGGPEAAAAFVEELREGLDAG